LLALKNTLPALSLLVFVALWQGLSLYVGHHLLPSPATVLAVFWRECQSGRLPYHLSITLLRLLAGFSIAMLLGCTIGIVLGRRQKLDAFFDHWLIIFLNIPALVTIILCYVWFGLVEPAAILAVVINKLPNVIVIIREGARSLDPDLSDMARCYRFGPLKTLKDVVWPQLFPFVMTATRTGIALIWKIILVVELLGRSNGMGYQLHLFFQLFDVSGLLAYTIAFVGIIQILELTVLKPLDNRARRWRQT
jgi:NitT/TauT family transport system permease protein